jgi:hypothetical protein
MKSNASNSVTCQQMTALKGYESGCVLLHEMEACKEVSPIEIHCHMQAVDGGNCVDMHTVLMVHNNRAWAGRVTDSFWDTGGVNHMDFLEGGTTISSECYIPATLRTLKQQLRKVLKHKNILPQLQR